MKGTQSFLFVCLFLLFVPWSKGEIVVYFHLFLNKSTTLMNSILYSFILCNRWYYFCFFVLWVRLFLSCTCASEYNCVFKQMKWIYWRKKFFFVKEEKWVIFCDLFFTCLSVSMTRRKRGREWEWEREGEKLRWITNCLFVFFFFFLFFFCFVLVYWRLLIDI